MKNEKNYLFKILWSHTYFAIAINEIYQNNYNVPITTFYFWPREDGWKLLKAELDSKPWFLETSKIKILNEYSMLINYWVENSDKKSKYIKYNINTLNIPVDILAINSVY